MPQNASEAAAQLLKWLPRVKSPNNDQYFHGFYKDGKPVFIQDSLDRSLALGTLQGIAEGRVTQGDKSLVGSINVTFIKPLQDAINDAYKKMEANGVEADSNKTPNPDIVENKRLLKTVLNGVDWAASFGVFSDQALQVKRGKHFDGVGFGAKEIKR